jgi:uncharacterized protein (DUF111 family)
MRILYFDCFSGISGDMTLAALVDAGANSQHVEQQLNLLLNQEEVKLDFKQVLKKGVSAKKLIIHVHDHDHHQHDHEHDGHHHDHHHHEHDGHHHHHHHHHHEHDGHHHHDHHHHEHDDPHHHDHHHHRAYSEIAAMIEKSALSSGVKQRAQDIFRVIGEAEAKIHNVPIETVHFHEVGALDSIIDIVGTAIALEDLQVEKIYASPVAVGIGYVKCDHGMYPIPAPATLEMLKGIPLRSSKEIGELTTPTGAGIISALTEEFGPLPAMIVQRIGYGAGTKELSMQPNVLRAVIGEI